MAGPIGIAVALAIFTTFEILDEIFGVDLFGGGGHTPIIPAGYYRIAHYPSAHFLWVLLALVPAQENSDNLEAPMGGRVIWVSGPASPPSASPSPTPSNGNLWGGFQKQEGVCSVPGSLGKKMNGIPCTRDCCKTHDNCYTKCKCNESSLFSPFGPCNTCNENVIGCVEGCL